MVDEKLQIKKININDIVPADYNPRQISEHDYQKLANSINEFGVVDPIIINLNDNTIIGGHQRFDVLFYDKNITDLYLLELGDIGWVFPDSELIIKDKDHEKALNLALNRIKGEWDKKKLSEVLFDLGDVNLDGLSGFDVELKKVDRETSIIPKPKPKPKPKKRDSSKINENPEIIHDLKSKERIKKGFVKKGDLFQIGNNFIVCGNINDENLRARMYGLINKNVQLPQTMNKKDFERTVINYYIIDDTDLMEKIILDNKERI